jgi:hypothetical protein
MIKTRLIGIVLAFLFASLPLTAVLADPPPDGKGSGSGQANVTTNGDHGGGPSVTSQGQPSGTLPGGTEGQSHSNLTEMASTSPMLLMAKQQ